MIDYGSKHVKFIHLQIRLLGSNVNLVTKFPASIPDVFQQVSRTQYNPQEKKTTKDELEEVYGGIESEIKNARKMEQHIIVMGKVNN